MDPPYPNYQHLTPGSRVPFWWYDTTEGWVVYGHGTVTADGRQVVPDASTRVHEFTGAMIGGPLFGTQPGALASWWESVLGYDGDPVELSSGQMVDSHTDLVLPGPLPVSVTRTYRTGDGRMRAFGQSSMLEYDMFLYSANPEGYQSIDLVLAGGQRVTFTRTSAGTGFRDALLTHTGTDTVWEGSQLQWNGGGWDLRQRNGMTYVFGDMSGLQAIEDRQGNRLSVVHQNGQGGPIVALHGSNGTWVRFGVDGAGRVTTATDNGGRRVLYAYDTNGRLITVTDPADGVRGYTYDSTGRMLTATDARNIVYLSNTYDATTGRVSQQTLSGGSTYGFAYAIGSDGKTTATTVTNPRSRQRQVRFDGRGNVTGTTEALGRPEQQVSTIERSGTGNRITAEVDAAGRRSSYQYDAYGNITSVTVLEGNALVASTTYTHAQPFDLMTSMSDSTGRTTTFTYDQRGNVLEVDAPGDARATFTYGDKGQRTSAKDALNQQTTYAYEGHTLVSVTDSLNRTSRRHVDGLGRLLVSTDASGVQSVNEYDRLNQLVRAEDGTGAVSSFTYDANGNVLTSTDATGSVTTMEYDTSDRLKKRTDPLLRAETFGWYVDGQLWYHNDRAGRKVTYDYDGLGRETWQAWGTSSPYQAVVRHKWDSADRLTAVEDSVAGNITFAYDDRDRLLTETTPAGNVVYGYDTRNRRSSMTLSGSTAVTYGYDTTDRLTGVTRGTTTSLFTYDALDRLITKTLPNGTVATHGYDAGSQLRSIAYARSGTAIGDLTYDYDTRGLPLAEGGSLAKANLPAAMTSATYDDAHQLSAWDATTFTYDRTGNALTEGSRSFTYDPRGRLVGAGNQTFTHDALGRRGSRAVAGGTTYGFRYDGDTAIQESRNGVTYVDMLATGTDGYVARIGSGWTDSMLTDARGSTVTTSDRNGVRGASWAYSAFGETTQTGSSSNTTQFTGRENDGDGLYHYRARTYAPKYGRFLQEDPAGEGQNPYSYVGNSPLAFTDPSGEVAQALLAGCAIGAVESIGIDLVTAKLTGRKMTAGGLLSSAGFGCASGVAGMGLIKGVGAVVGRGASKAGVAGAPAGSAGTSSATTGLMNARYFASLQQMGEAGTVIAGGTRSTAFRGASQAAQRYGGQAADYVKKSSLHFTDQTGRSFETHWIENLRTAARFEFKTKLVR